jgi:2-C-methyl-D-erythritol 4-phosphate cytidylyltransferase
VDWTLDAVRRSGCFERIAVVVSPERAATVRWDGVAVVAGGERRRDSVAAGVETLGDCDIVCVHDAARPLCAPELFSRVIAAARERGAATTAIPCVDTIKRVSAGLVMETLPRDQLVAVQTPQAFAAELLRRAHAASTDDASDDCLLVERLGAPVAVVDGDPRNRKITTAADIEWLRAELEP